MAASKYLIESTPQSTKALRDTEKAQHRNLDLVSACLVEIARGAVGLARAARTAREAGAVLPVALCKRRRWCACTWLPEARVPNRESTTWPFARVRDKARPAAAVVPARIQERAVAIDAAAWLPKHRGLESGCQVLAVRIDQLWVRALELCPRLIGVVLGLQREERGLDERGRSRSTHSSPRRTIHM